MAKIIIFGTGDIAQIANYYFKIDSEHEVVAFTVDKAFITEDHFESLPLIAFDDLKKQFPPSDYKMFIALSYSKMNKIRAQKYMEAKQMGYSLISYVSSHCTYLSQYPPGENCFIFEDNTIQPYVKIGNNVTLWSGNHIGHHSIIEDHNFISSHVVVSGHCHIKSYSFLGVNSTLGHKVTVEEGTLLGAGVVTTKNTVANGVYVSQKPVLLEKKSNEVNM